MVLPLPQAKKISDKLKNLASPRKSELNPADIETARDYIQAYWHKLERYHPKDDENLIGLPKPFLVPSYEEGHEFDYNELYYWDSYFMIQGILDEKHKDLVIGILENLAFMFNRFKIIPNGSRLYYLSRSQPPFLTSFIWDVYDVYDMPQKWLDKMMKVAIAEYETVWTGTRKPNARKVYRDLSRYYDFNYLHDIAETESGWDMTPRFSRKALDYLPIDLNALLYKYEMDFVRYWEFKQHEQNATIWRQKAKHRKRTINELMWSKQKGLYYDYNYVKEKRGNVSSLAAYYAMWAGMCSDEQAAKMVSSLNRFEYDGGLSATDLQPTKYVQVIQTTPTQWAYPNGWAPLHFLVIEGLENYGYRKEAERIARKWLATNLAWFKKHGIFLEKYNVVSPKKPPEKGLYPSQTGFGWTNGVFEYLAGRYL